MNGYLQRERYRRSGAWRAGAGFRGYRNGTRPRRLTLGSGTVPLDGPRRPKRVHPLHLVTRGAGRPGRADTGPCGSGSRGNSTRGRNRCIAAAPERPQRHRNGRRPSLLTATANRRT